ncbi:hypothetical protein M885DRAFT_545408 [Pelagophyceae sp. CCMP2097]|nr:hypothetical protein M885DRAFT_545408 [Pelagophyceae sp. CCMP2097]
MRLADRADADLAANLAASLYELGDYARAIECFEAAIRIDPLHARAKADLALVREYVRATQSRPSR